MDKIIDEGLNEVSDDDFVECSECGDMLLEYNVTLSKGERRVLCDLCFLWDLDHAKVGEFLDEKTHKWINVEHLKDDKILKEIYNRISERRILGKEKA
jgi:hypothetical protein